MTPDCAHIAAAAVFGIISWDPCMDKLLSALETGETRRDGVAVLVSRVVALLADALPRRKDGSECRTVTSLTSTKGTREASGARPGVWRLSV